LEVYSSFELDQLKQKPSFPVEFIENSMREMFGNTSAGEKDDGFNISTIEQVQCTSIKDVDIDIVEATEEVDIDDI
jgi:hypothetical protein